LTLLDQGKLKTESEICIGCWEGVCHKRIIHGMIGKKLKIKTVAQNVVSRCSDAEHFHPGHRLVYIFNKFPGNCLIITNRKVKSYIKVTFKYFLSVTGFQDYLNIIKPVSCTEYELINPVICYLITGQVQRNRSGFSPFKP
jgi:hypothetical protein